MTENKRENKEQRKPREKPGKVLQIQHGVRKMLNNEKLRKTNGKQQTNKENEGKPMRNQ